MYVESVCIVWYVVLGSGGPSSGSFASFVLGPGEEPGPRM